MDFVNRISHSKKIETLNQLGLFWRLDAVANLWSFMYRMVLSFSILEEYLWKHFICFSSMEVSVTNLSEWDLLQEQEDYKNVSNPYWMLKSDRNRWTSPQLDFWSSCSSQVDPIRIQLPILQWFRSPNIPLHRPPLTPPSTYLFPLYYFLWLPVKNW